MGWCTKYAEKYPSVVDALLQGYNGKFGEALNQIYEIIDDLLLGEESLDEKNSRTCTE